MHHRSTQDPSASRAPPPQDDVSEQIAAILRERGIVTHEQLTYACRVRGKLRNEYPLIKVLRELGYLATRQMADRDQ
ncbi:hypothetical protein CCR95_05135 [Thiocystis minor]|uniref:hypothetical protein n=1 Tax=Thiocystis minor TaxID=61597 RepID=UPI0019124856|nr:hypothetical protein [Thiocystis minor]MBK5963488.1 hypothetical protein [Thiocystis minor]